MIKKGIFKRMLSVASAFVLGVMSLGSASVFAAETEKTAVLEDASVKPIVLQADSGVVVVITPLSDDYVPPVRAEEPINTYFDFTGSLYGIYRYYSGNHFSVDMVTSSEGSGSFTFKLQRQGTWWPVTVASTNLSQNGSFHIEFLNVYNPNTYRFAFEQFIGNTYHQYGTMTIYNWD